MSDTMRSINVQQLVSQLSLQEKISLIAGRSTWRTAEIERLGIPNVKVSDGPSGARGEIFGEGVPAAFLPSGVSLGAAWDEDLLYQMGELLAEECKSKSASVILAPTMCIHRHPLGGRNFESFSEDPFLTGKLASAHVRGVQSKGVGATPKHYVANDQETKRFHSNAIVSARALHEVYLLPFQMVVRDADPWCMMTAYNKVNGSHCDMSHDLLTKIPRDSWGWDGVFMSDWGGTNAVAGSINAGLDLEMPGPPTRRQLDAVMDLVRQGAVEETQIDRLVTRILGLLEKTGRFEDSSDRGEVCLNPPEQKEKLAHVAQSGIVLLKNEDNALPLLPAKNINKLLIAGPNAKRVVAGGGGSSYIKAPYWTSVFDSVAARFNAASTTKIQHAIGARMNRFIPSIPAAVVRNPDTGNQGAMIDWMNGHDMSAEVVAKTHIDDLYYMSFGNAPPEISGETNFCFRMRTILTPLTSGLHKMSLASIGPSTLYIDDSLVATIDGKMEHKESLFFTYGSGEFVFEKHMNAGQEYNVRIECHSHDRQVLDDWEETRSPMEDKFQGFRLGYQEYDSRNLPAEAAKDAQGCDAAILVVGRDKEWETEGEDIPCFELPGEQVELITQVAAVCPRTIVVIQAGTPVQMEPWIHQVQGVLYAWYQGQELGNAVASVICGEFNPTGRLPITFPRRLEDCPAFSSFPGENLESWYSEGLYVGYRWWDLVGTSPLFPIGYGLSYNRFELFNASLSAYVLEGNQPIRVIASVRNLGGSDLPGRETVIAWFRPVSTSKLSRPRRQICGFVKTSLLLPGKACEVQIPVDAYGLGMYDSKDELWRIEAGSRFEIILATSAEEIVVGIVDVPEEISWVHLI